MGLLYNGHLNSYMRRTHQNPSVCFADIIPAGPQKEGALVCSKGANLGPARGSSAGPSLLKKGDC
jgi:hypothetical protein